MREETVHKASCDGLFTHLGQLQFNQTYHDKVQIDLLTVNYSCLTIKKLRNNKLQDFKITLKV